MTLMCLYSDIYSVACLVRALSHPLGGDGRGTGTSVPSSGEWIER